MAPRRRSGRSSLACFIQALEGSRVVVELRYDAIVRGTLLAADEQLNLQLADASYQPLQGARRQADYLHVRGRHVRFVHLPANLDPAAAIEQHSRRVAQAMRQHAVEQQQTAGRLQKGQQLELGSAAAGAPQAHAHMWAPMETE